MKPALIFRKYQSSDLEVLRAVFFSNVPPYFEVVEWDDFEAFLKDDIVGDCYYDVVLLNEEVIGAGGIALNDDDTVSLCWGMMDKRHHKKGFGVQLLEHRLSWAEQTFPGKAVGLSTAQYTNGFFEKYGFETTEIIEDFWAKGLHGYKMIKRKDIGKD